MIDRRRPGGVEGQNRFGGDDPGGGLSSRLSLLLICGPSASGKTHAALDVLARRYDVMTTRMDELYRRALFATGQAVRNPGDPSLPRDAWLLAETGEPLSLHEIANELRGDRADHPLASGFDTELRRLLVERVRLARAAGVAFVVEGYALRFAREVETVVEVATEGVEMVAPPCRIEMRPSLERWSQNREKWARDRERPPPNPPTDEQYERQFTPPEPVGGVRDFTAVDDAELVRIVEGEAGIRIRAADFESLYLAGAGDAEADRMEVLLSQRQRMLGILADRQAQLEARLSESAGERQRLVEERQRLAEERREASEALAAVKGELDAARRAAEEAARREAGLEARLSESAGERQRLVEERQRLAEERREASEALAAVKGELDAARRAAEEAARREAELAAALDAARGHAERAIRSRSWRWGHAVARAVRTLTFRRSRRPTGSIEAAVTELQRAERLLAAPVTDGPPRADSPHLPLPVAEGEPDAVSAPAVPRPPVDVGAWAAAAESAGILLPAGEAEVDVVICVHDALDDTERCLRALFMKTTTPVHLIVVDDGSAKPAAETLTELAGRARSVELIVREQPPHGYTRAANAGLAASTAETVVLLNSDTEVTYGWLEALLAAAESEPDVGLVGPLSNAASFQSVPVLSEAGTWATNPLPEWMTPDGMAFVVGSIPGPEAIDVPLLNGFCLALRREVIDRVGTLDEERFGDGYGEENDLCLRVGDAGLKRRVALRSYVQHAKSASYGDARRDLSSHGTRNLIAKHGRRTVEGAVDSMHGSEALNRIRDQVAEVVDAGRAGIATLVEGGALRIAFLLPGLSEGGSGGSHSVVQEVAGLRALGADASIVVPEKALDRARRAYPDELPLFAPYADGELPELLSDRDVAVATHHISVREVLDATEGRRDVLRAYYVQDYEPWFFPTGSQNALTAAGTYDLMAGGLLFAKTDWLCNTVSARHPLRVMRVEPSLARERFQRLRESGSNAAPRVVAMVRPRTPRRQGAETVRLLEAVARRFGEDAEAVTFGCTEEELAALTDDPGLRTGHRGILSRDAVAELLGSSDVFVDLSTYQAFGRTALEAMACGCAVVGPREGALPEVAGPKAAALVDTTSGTEPFEAIVELIEDRGRLASMQAAGRRIAGGYSIERAALSEYALFSAFYELGVRSPRVSL